MGRTGLLSVSLALTCLSACELEQSVRSRPDGGLAGDAATDGGSLSDSGLQGDNACERATAKLLDWCQVDVSMLAEQMEAAAPPDMDGGSEDAGPRDAAVLDCSGQLECIAGCTLEATCEQILDRTIADNPYLACIATCMQ